MKIGIAGTGKMGTAMGARLLELKHEVHVWNRSAARTRPLLDQGARSAATPAELAGRCDAVLTILTDAAAIEAVYKGTDGLLSGNVGGRLFIEMSTVSSSTERALAPAVAASGAALVECPVGGSTTPAREGKLFGFLGGSDADAARARPLLEQLCRRVEHVGGIGSGSAMKLAINLPLAVYWEALGEAVSLVRDAGIAPEKLIEIMTESSGGTNVLRNRGPKLVAALKEGPKAEVGFDIDGMGKDLRTMLAVGGAMGIDLPVTAKALDCYEAASRAGWGNRDASNLVAHRLEQAKSAKR